MNLFWIAVAVTFVAIGSVVVMEKIDDKKYTRKQLGMIGVSLVSGFAAIVLFVLNFFFGVSL